MTTNLTNNQTTNQTKKLTPNRTSGVYALVDPETQKIMYIGQSVDVAKRFQQHLDIHHYEPNLEKRRWLMDLRTKGLKPRLVLLEEHDDLTALDEAEKRLIRDFKVHGEAELNIAAGGSGCSITKVFNSKQTEWIALGKKVKACRSLLFEITADVERLAGKKYAKSLRDLVCRLDGAKSVLDSVLYRTFPEWREFTKVFYGPESPSENS